MVTPKGNMSTEGETLQFLSYLTGARYVHPWWRGRCQSCNQVPAIHGKSRGHVIYHSCDKGSWRQSLLSTARCCNVCGRNLITGLTAAASPSVDMSSTCKVGQKLRVSVPLLTFYPSAWPSRLLYRRGRKSRRDLWITLYFYTASWRLPIHQSTFNGTFEIVHLLQTIIHKMKCNKNNLCPFVHPNVLSLNVSDVQHNRKEHVNSKRNISFNSSYSLQSHLHLLWDMLQWPSCCAPPAATVLRSVQQNFSTSNIYLHRVAKLFTTLKANMQLQLCYN
jgi:hypothetical protein